MMNTTHLFNKAAQRYVDTGTFVGACSSNGLSPGELLTAIRERVQLMAAENPPAGDLDFAVMAAGNMFMFGLETGKLLCDPATHLAAH